MREDQFDPTPNALLLEFSMEISAYAAYVDELQRPTGEVLRGFDGQTFVTETCGEEVEAISLGGGGGKFLIRTKTQEELEAALEALEEVQP